MRGGTARPRTACAAAVAACCCLWLAGCAAPSPAADGRPEPVFRDPAMSMQEASGLVPPGTTRAEVLAALGSAGMIRFDSGFEVWVYPAAARQRAAGQAEFVVLFDPAGIVRKTRLRPATPQLPPLGR
ncbi:hypothetical protein [Variovorax terrae]|uniref:Lipoprotein SmpA/OmlA domain-containing protein n=1 Tax=Variovorax terrae TaxID=2923278 RepID=A0A9X2AML0_9BURK|nr:hypothetical protein [Variovorax terrae]MCJ0762905.1 hypothetical protein [Variovorax terrae]